MGKSPKPLKIVVTDPAMLNWPEFQELASKGHVIEALATDADIVMGSNCWLMTSAHSGYLTLAVSQARAVKYPKAVDDIEAARTALANPKNKVRVPLEQVKDRVARG